MELMQFQQAVIRAAQKQGLADYELYFRYADGVSVDVYGRDEVKDFCSATEGGVCFRCAVQGKMGYASTQLLSEEAAEEIVRRAMDNAAALEKEEPIFLSSGEEEYPAVPNSEETMPDSKVLIQKALRLQEALYAAHPGVGIGTENEVGANHTTIRIWNSRGLDLNYDRTFATAVAVPVVEENGEKDNEAVVAVGRLDTLDVEKLARKAVGQAREKLGAEVPETGIYPVVFAPDAMSSLLAAFSTVFSAETAQKGLSLLRDREGEKIAASVVTMVDDPLSEMSAMPIPFDAEGVPTRRKNVVEKGVLTTLLYDRRRAAEAGKTTTGNACKRSYAAPVSVQPFTFYLAAGDCSEEELVQKAGEGIYIRTVGGLHAGANPISGDFSLQSSGFQIENGKKTKPIRSFTVAGNFFDLLKRVVAVADNLEVPAPGDITCYGSPSVLVDGLSVAGR